MKKEEILKDKTKLSRLLFLDSASDIVSEEYDLDEALGIAESEELSPNKIKTAAENRISNSLELEKKFFDPIQTHSPNEKILSYPIARLIVSLTNNPFLYYLFSMSEAKRFVNLSKKYSNAPSSDSLSEDERQRYDQISILNELGYTSVTTESIPAPLYLSQVPEEYHNISSFNTQIEEEHIETTDELLDTLLFWCSVRKIRGNLPFENVPDKIEEALEKSVVDITRNIPNRYKLSKRGLTKEVDYSNIDTLLSNSAPPVLYDASIKLKKNVPTTKLETQMVLRTLLDCTVETEEIVDWLEFDSTWTQSYGRDLLFDLQGDIVEEEYGFTSYTLSELHATGNFTNAGTVYQLTEYTPVYIALSEYNQLFPTNIREV